MKKIERKQVYHIEVIHYTDGTSHMRRTNKGFSVVEMLGLLSLVKADLVEVFRGGFKAPNTIARKSTGSPIMHKKS